VVTTLGQTSSGNDCWDGIPLNEDIEIGTWNSNWRSESAEGHGEGEKSDDSSLEHLDRFNEVGWVK